MLGRILVFFGGLLALALTAALLVPYFVDWTDFRRDFETQASRILGKKVVVHGAVDARLLPFPSVTMTDVRVGQDEDGEALITVTRFSMDAELAPLLSGEALIYDMRLERPRLRLKLNADGTLDWMRTGTPQIPAASVVLEQVEINGAEVIFIDEQTGRTRSAQNVDARLSAETLAGPWKMAGTGMIDGIRTTFNLAAARPDDQGAVALRARIEPDDWPVTTELEGMIRLVDLKPRYDGRFDLSFRRPDPQAAGRAEADAARPRLDGTFELSNDRIRIPTYELKIGNPADPYIISGEATLDTGRTPEFLLTADGQQIDMERFGTPGDGDGDAATGGSLADRVRAALAVAADIPIPQVPGKAEISLPAILAGDTAIRDIRLSVEPNGAGWTIRQAAALLPGRTTIEASGELRLKGEQGFSGKLLLASNQPSGLAEWVAGGVPASIRTLKSAGFSANVDLSAEVQRLEALEIALGPLSLNGRLERAALRDQAPSLSVELAGNGFDLEAMQGLAAILVGNAAPSALIDHTIAAKLDLGAFSAFGETAGDVSALVSLAERRLAIERLDIGDLRGASIAATGTVDLAGEAPTGQVKADIKAADTTGIIGLLAERLPAHPLTARLAAQADQFAGLDVTADISVGGEEWPYELAVAGTANGTEISLRHSARMLDLTKPGELLTELEAKNPNVAILLAQLGLPVLPFDGPANGQVIATIEEAEDSEPFARLAFTADGTTISVEGQTSLAANHFLEGSYSLTAESEDIEPLLFLGGIALPQSGTGLPVSLKTSLYVTPEAVIAEGLTGTIDQNAIAANLSLARTVSPARIEGDLTLDSVDLEILAESVFGPVRDATGALNSAALGDPADRGVDLRVSVAATRLFAGALPPLSNARFALDGKTGQMRLSGLEGDVAGGRLTGTLGLSNAAGTGLMEASLKLAGADLSALATGLGSPLTVSGKTDLTMSLEASGKALAVMPENVTGSGVLGIADLGIGGLNQAALPLLLTEADSVEGDLSEAAILPGVTRHLAEGPFQAKAASIPFTIAGGTLRAQNIAIANPMATLTGEAAIDLAANRIEATARLAFAKGNDDVAGAEAAVSLEFAGVANDPGRVVKANELANFLSLRKFEAERRRVETLQGRLMERQRLRREAALYKTREEARRFAREYAEAQARLMREAMVIIRAKAREEAEARRARQPVTELVPDDTVIDGGDLPAPTP